MRSPPTLMGEGGGDVDVQVSTPPAIWSGLAWGHGSSLPRWVGVDQPARTAGKATTGLLTGS